MAEATIVNENNFINGVNVGILPPTYAEYAGDESFFGGEAPLSVAVGYLVVLGFGVLFSILTTLLVLMNKHFGAKGDITSEHFK